MACLVNRKEGKITSVKTSDNKKSKLFEAIHSIPFLAGSETSLEVYKNAYSDRVQKDFEGAENNVYDTNEPKLFIKGKRGTYDNIEEAIVADERGSLQAGFKNPKTDAFIPVVNFNTETSERSEFIFDSIQQGILSPNRIMDKDGNTFFEGKGKNLIDKKMGAHATKFEAYTNGNARVKIDSTGKVTIPNTDSVSRVEMQDGSVKYIKVEDTLEEINKSNPVNRAELLYDYLVTVEKVVPDFSTDITKNKEEADNLRVSLMNFMKMMGFNMATLKSYSERYNSIHGQDPDVQALADMGNKIVAFREGRIGIEDLSEEVAHIAIEFYADQNSVASVIANIHLTEEYGEYAEYYRSKYSVQHKGNEVALEEQVRKEVLGKILKNELSRRFSKENRSEERKTMIDRLMEIWSNFVDSLTRNVNRRHVREMNRLNYKIADSVLSGRIGSFDLNIESDNVYYNAMSKKSKTTESKIQIAKKQLEELYRKEMNSDIPSKQALERVSADMSTYNMFTAVNSIAGTAASQADVLLKSLEEAAKEGVPASREDLLRVSYLESTKSVLSSLMSDLNKMDLNTNHNGVNHGQKMARLKKEIESSVKEMDNNYTKSLPLVDENDKVTRERILERALEESELTEEERQNVRDMWNSDKKDISFIGRYFGMMSSQKNPVLALLAKLVKDMKTMVNKQLIGVANPFLDEVDKKGQEKFQKSIIKNRGGKQTYFYLSPQNQALFHEDLLNKQVELLSELVVDSAEEELRERIKTESAYSILKEKNLQDEYVNRIKEWKKANTESFNNEEYERQKLERYKKAYVSDATVETISNKNSARRERDKRYQDENGNIDSSLKTEADKLQDQTDRNNYRAVLSPMEAGEVRVGLRIVSTQELSEDERSKLSKVLPYNLDSDYNGDIVVPDGNMETKEDYKRLADELIQESRVSLDLNTLNMSYRDQLSKQERQTGFNDQFFERLKSVHESGKSAYDWALSNSSLAFTSEYYEALSGEDFVGYLDAAKDMIDDMEESEEKDKAIVDYNELKRLMSEKKYLTKLYRKEGKPMEIDVTSMREHDRDKMIKNQEDMENIKGKLRVPSEYFSESKVKLSDRVLSSDFYDEVEASGMSVYDYAIQKRNMTTSKISDTTKFATEITRFLGGYQVEIGTRYKEFVTGVSQRGELEGMSQEEKIEHLKDEYAKTNVAVYFQRFEPAGATAFLNDLSKEENFDKLEKFLKRDTEFIANNDVSEFIEMSADYTWSQDIGNEENRNKRYMNDEYYLQPKLVNEDGTPSKYVDKEFFDKYGIDLDKWLENPHLDMNTMNPTRNREEFDFLKNVISMREQGLEMYNQSSSYSKFQRAQVTRTAAEKFTDATRLRGVKSSFKDSWKDIFRDRADEKMYGDTVDTKTLVERGEELNVKTIPTYFLDQLQDPSLLSQNTIQTELMFLKEAALYQARVQQESDFQSLLRKVEKDDIMSTGLGGKVNKIQKGGQNSSMYMKASEYLDYHLYGVRQTRKMQGDVLGVSVDFTKVINVIQSFTRFGNLAFNPIVDVTSFTTGQTVNWGDRLAGDYYHKSSFDRALRSTPKVFKYIAESGKIHKRSELNHLMELFTVESIDDRLENSAQGRAVKLIDRSPFGLSKVSNMGIKPQVMFSNLMDVRFIGGKFQSWQQYYNSRKAEDSSLNKKTIESEFKNASKESLYDHLDISKQGISFNDKFKDRFENPSEEFDKLVRRMSSKIENMIQITDTVINDTDRLAAQRDVLTNQFMMHRGWLPINLAKRFKPEQINFTTGKIEQGHYRSAAEMIAKIVRAGDVRKMNEVIREMPKGKRANLIRVTFEFGMLAAMAVLANFIFAADDDDDSYLEDALQYAYLRTSREFFASTVLGTGKSVIETLKSPITAIRTLENLEPVKLLGTTYDAVTGDLDPAWDTVESLTALKRFDQLSDLQEQINSYFHFNESTIPFQHPKAKERKRQKKLREELKEERKRRRERENSLSVTR
jgi:hypothetical protein